MIMQPEPKKISQRAKEIVKAFAFVGVGLVVSTVKDTVLDHLAPKRLLGDEVKEQVWNAMSEGVGLVMRDLVPDSPPQRPIPRPDPYRPREYNAAEVRGRRVTFEGTPHPV